MNLLAFDTSTEYLSIALLKDGQTLSDDCLAGQAHSQLILPTIHALLEKAHLQLSDLNGIAFGAGPGSFTGVRIAAAVAQGLGFGENLPVAPVCTLLALAENAGHHQVIACLDARMGEVYHAAYQKVSGEWQCALEAGLYKPEEVPLVEGVNWMGVGSGWHTYTKELSTAYSGKLQAIKPELLPTASAILKLATSVFLKGEAKPASEAVPIYIRNRVALKTAEREQGQRL